MSEPEPNPVTGWDRARWSALADAMLAAVRPYASPGRARITLPGVEGGYGRAVDGLEGFARTFLAAGFRIAGEGGAGLDELAQWYAEGIASGVDPASPERWVRLSEHSQAKVEAASIALVLDLTRPWIWERLSARTQEQTVTYLAEAVGDHTYPRNNWCWFRLVVQTFLRSVGGPFSLEDMEADLAAHDSYSRAHGWYSDGDERSFDHYAGWALHLYPTLWGRMRGAEHLAAPRAAADRERLDRYLMDYLLLIGADGAPLVQGRSLTYRFAAAAPLWVGALAGVPSVDPGLLRRAASGMVGYFGAHHVPDERGLLTPGWHRQWLPMLQSYSGPCSPYWASKGLLGLALPADHPAWTSPERPLPVECGDVVAAVAAPGWLVSGTRADGVVRVYNHGTDHARPGDRSGDSPLYARLGYSTATWPWVDEASWRHPTDQSVALVDRAERVSHRAGWAPAAPAVVDGVGVAGSCVDAHWIDMPVRQTLHGSGWSGRADPAGRIDVVSLVRGPWEVRLVTVVSLADGVPAEDLTLRVTGWPTVAGDGLDSRIEAVLGSGVADRLHREQVSPLGPGATVPRLQFPVQVGETVAALVTLARTAVPAGPARVVVGASTVSSSAVPSFALSSFALSSSSDDVAVVVWPDGVRTRTPLPRVSPPPPEASHP